MTAIVDAGPAVALMDRRDRLQATIERLLRDEPGELILPAPVSAEVDYLTGVRLGRLARRAFLEDLAAGRFQVACLEPSDYELILSVDRAYADLGLGLADLSVVALAHRFRTRRIVTFDERHFRAVRPLDGGSFLLLPGDQPSAAGGRARRPTR